MRKQLAPFGWKLVGTSKDYDIALKADHADWYDVKLRNTENISKYALTSRDLIKMSGTEEFLFKECKVSQENSGFAVECYNEGAED